jgi:hypothetical protein
MPAPTNCGGHNNVDNYGSALWVRDASFIRLKNITLSYEINKTLLSKAGISLARIYLTADNVALLYSPLKIFDPELAGSGNNPDPKYLRPGTSESGGQPIPGIRTYPLMRTFTLGVNFSF